MAQGLVIVRIRARQEMRWYDFGRRSRQLGPPATAL
jgi:hypothetical protein